MCDVEYEHCALIDGVYKGTSYSGEIHSEIDQETGDRRFVIESYESISEEIASAIENLGEEALIDAMNNHKCLDL